MLGLAWQGIGLQKWWRARAMVNSWFKWARYGVVANRLPEAGCKARD